MPEPKIFWLLLSLNAIVGGTFSDLSSSSTASPVTLPLSTAAPRSSPVFFGAMREKKKRVV